MFEFVLGILAIIPMVVLNLVVQYRPRLLEGRRKMTYAFVAVWFTLFALVPFLTSMFSSSHVETINPPIKVEQQKNDFFREPPEPKRNLEQPNK